MEFLMWLVDWIMLHKATLLWICIGYCGLMFLWGAFRQGVYWTTKQKTQEGDWTPWQMMTAAVVMAAPAVIFLIT